MQIFSYRIFTAENESDLSAGIGWDCAVGVVGNWEKIFAEVAHGFDEVEVQPETLS